MTTSRERWATVERLYHAARAQPAGTRAAFLAEACAGDEELRGHARELASHLSISPAVLPSGTFRRRPMPRGSGMALSRGHPTGEASQWSIKAPRRLRSGSFGQMRAIPIESSLSLPAAHDHTIVIGKHDAASSDIVVLNDQR